MTNDSPNAPLSGPQRGATHLIPSLGILGATGAVGWVMLAMAVWSVWRLPETYGRDLDFV